MFAFLPEMVLDHLNQAKPTEYRKISNEAVIEKITITADPEIPNLDSITKSNIEPIKKTTAKNKNAKAIKKTEFVEKSNLGTSNTETVENTINRFLKKFKHYLS